MSDVNYGQPSNRQYCQCGCHHGTGAWSPAKRAERYGFQRDRLFPFMTFQQKLYLASWEVAHGPVLGDWVPRLGYVEEWNKWKQENFKYQPKTPKTADTRIYT